MKKIILTLTLSSVIALTTNAQRTVDLELTKVLTPDTVFHQVYPVVKFIIKNLGQDSILPTDTLGYSIEFFFDGGSKTFPDDLGLYTYKKSFDKKLLIGDTIMITWKCPTYFLIKKNYKEGTIAVGFDLISGPGPNNVRDTRDANNGNNKSNVVYYNPKLFIEESKVSNEFVIYPNPINDNSKIVFNSANSVNRLILIYDTNGKELMKINTTDNEINIGSIILNSGIYTLQIISNNQITTTKLIK